MVAHQPFVACHAGPCLAKPRHAMPGLRGTTNLGRPYGDRNSKPTTTQSSVVRRPVRRVC